MLRQEIKSNKNGLGIIYGMDVENELKRVFDEQTITKKLEELSFELNAGFLITDILEMKSLMNGKQEFIVSFSCSPYFSEEFYYFVPMLFEISFEKLLANEVVEKVKTIFLELRDSFLFFERMVSREKYRIEEVNMASEDEIFLKIKTLCGSNKRYLIHGVNSVAIKENIMEFITDFVK